MNWKSETVKDLREFRALENFINEYPSHMEELDTQLKHLRSAKVDAVPTAGGGCRTDDAWLNIIAKKERLAWNYGNRLAKYRRIKKALALLNSEEMFVLHEFFIERPGAGYRAKDKGHVDKCMSRLCCGQSEVYRRKEDALRTLAIALYGQTED